MEIRLETELKIVDQRRTMAGVHLEIAGYGGLTISNILLYQDESTDRWTLRLPIITIGQRKRPALTMQGEVKTVVFRALQEDHRTLRQSAEKRLKTTHILQK